MEGAQTMGLFQNPRTAWENCSTKMTCPLTTIVSEYIWYLPLQIYPTESNIFQNPQSTVCRYWFTQACKGSLAWLNQSRVVGGSSRQNAWQLSPRTWILIDIGYMNSSPTITDPKIFGSHSNYSDFLFY